jgi:hypothetical protein
MWQAEDLVWVHDYHLMLMPRMLRQKLCNNGAESAQVTQHTKAQIDDRDDKARRVTHHLHLFPISLSLFA